MKLAKTLTGAAALLSLLAFGACKSKETGTEERETRVAAADPAGEESTASADTEEVVLAVEGMT